MSNQEVAACLANIFTCTLWTEYLLTSTNTLACKLQTFEDVCSQFFLVVVCDLLMHRRNQKRFEAKESCCIVSTPH